MLSLRHQAMQGQPVEFAALNVFGHASAPFGFGRIGAVIRKLKPPRSSRESVRRTGHYRVSYHVSNDYIFGVAML